MAHPLDGTLDIPCPACGKTISKRLSDIQRKPKFSCPDSECVGTIDATEFAAKFREAQDRLDDMLGDLGGSIKL